MTEKYPGVFITLEGPEGAGKTTQLKLLSKYLEDSGIR
jgi:thymidylate kinase